MLPEAVIAVIDVGKTNKKLLLFNEAYEIVHERSARFLETVDEDGFPCENLESLKTSVLQSIEEVLRMDAYQLKAVNFSAYGASFVPVDESGIPLTPLYNYLKPYPEPLRQQFYAAYGGEEAFALRTASPVLGSLNSGMQLYRIKQEQPTIFREIRYALHLPQYLSYLLGKTFASDSTSIGCHTNLWDFEKGTYHEWTGREGVLEKLAPVQSAETTVLSAGGYRVGFGLHDSSAALIPYLIGFKEPFVLISTGTWCISLNPFYQAPLTAQHLERDCLCYLQSNGQPVTASRLFAGNTHEEGVKRIAAHFGVSALFYKGVEYDAELLHHLQVSLHDDPSVDLFVCRFAHRNLELFVDERHAYHQLMRDIVAQQKVSTGLILNEGVKRLFVDGGFSCNPLFMTLLAQAFPHLEVFAASMAQATALGSALAIHDCWNAKPIPSNLVELKYYKQ